MPHWNARFGVVEEDSVSFGLTWKPRLLKRHIEGSFVSEILATKRDTLGTVSTTCAISRRTASPARPRRRYDGCVSD